ncbi:hypothetical protein EDD52_1188 [Primorskyibacter sedentarius]|uniref:Uncharacterized protein n=1 Tax=Primorskyibacter sedentarius TaxID=745311 RepID=A0A4R3J3C3_9RHOB|nr:hypothetical protein EDD52_1188 [Primorskyibacter sedentarius]
MNRAGFAGGSNSFVTGMKIPVPMSGPGSRIRVYGATIRDRGTRRGQADLYDEL